ncbi:helix-turn-helix domain-containing protein [Actinomadura macra]|uniref:helix-turn-helix domain-containing protein n=1 Tax=Actinomadura macra TaxID=46164 RepID=UPI000AE877A6|nr:helix-turn-helix transcriptional regulator [Actinomadura macra]
MNERPEQRPEGALIAAALKRSRMSQRQAAAKAEISENRFRAIVHGYQTVSAGSYAPVRGPADTVARIARVVGVTPEQLVEAGRIDAAEELRGDTEAVFGDLPVPTDEELRQSGLQPETVEALLEMRRAVERMVQERNEDAIRRTNRVIRAMTDEQEAG